MQKVKLSDVVKRANTKEDRFNTNLIYYVGGEHIESNNVVIENRGLIKGSTIGPMFYFGFKKNDVLLVSRNPHLRKSGRVTFDGICSEKTFVMETIDEKILSQDYLPFIFQTDDFWNYAEDHKSGSVNFFLNWSTLANYEFNLPSLPEQKKLAKTLWSIVATMESYKKLLAKTDEMVKAKFVEMFGDPISNTMNWNIESLENLFPKIGRGKQPEYCEKSNICVINQACIYKNQIKFENAKFHSGTSKKITLEINSGDVLINSTGTGTLGRCNVFIPNSDSKTYIADGHVTVIKKSNNMDSIFLKTYINLSDVQELIYSNYVSGSTNQIELSKEKLSKHKIIVPPITIQNEFSYFVNKSEESKSTIQASFDSLTKVYKKIIAENLGGNE